MNGVIETPKVEDQQVYFGYKSEELRKEFDEKGYIVLRDIFKSEADDINRELERLLEEGRVGYNFTGNKVVFANRESDLIDGFTKQPELMALLSFLLKWPVLPFQTINFNFGSEQRAHSDSIHMSTYPEGLLTAIWIALEDIDSDQGPLFYYPGSHKWPYQYNEDLGLKENFFLLDENPNQKYENRIARLIEEHPIQPEYFTPKKGDILVWHPNLVHGGSVHENKSKTRKSMVVHYFGKDVICYHELTQRPAILK
jgi:ectoine hydroxylase-related dioxygenase (phytanoyl-CoA dioxygenase family)